MTKNNLNQLDLFEPFSYPLYSESPCKICSSTFEVLEILFLIPGDKIKQLVFLCSKCRSHPTIKKEI